MFQNQITQDTSASAELAAMRDFDELYRRAMFGRLFGKLSGREQRLQSLDGATSGYKMNSSLNRNVRPVRLSRIKGSVGRSNDFDENFRPLKRHLRRRWASVACAVARGDAVDAVQLMQVGSRLFVVDGHHRISVASANGQLEIDAQIHVWKESAEVEKKASRASAPVQKQVALPAQVLHAVRAVLHALSTQLRAALPLQAQTQS